MNLLVPVVGQIHDDGDNSLLCLLVFFIRECTMDRSSCLDDLTTRMRRNKNLRLIGFFCLVVVWLVVELNPLQSEHQFWRTIQAKDDLVSLPFTFPTLPDVIAINKTVADRQPHTESIAGNIGNNNFRGEKEVWPVKQTAAICSIIRDENRYLEEWTLYHLALGFDRIHIYDNSDTSAALRWLRDEQGNNTILQEGVLIHPFKNKANKRQLKAFRNCMKVYGKKHTWVAFLDPDEFLVLKKHDRVVDLLTHHCANGSLGINWVLFGTSNQTTYDDSPVTRRFQYHMGVDEHIKTIVKVSDYLGQQSAHWVKLADPTMRRDTNGKWIQGPKYSGKVGNDMIFRKIQQNCVFYMLPKA